MPADVAIFALMRIGWPPPEFQPLTRKPGREIACVAGVARLASWSCDNRCEQEKLCNYRGMTKLDLAWTPSSGCGWRSAAITMMLLVCAAQAFATEFDRNTDRRDASDTVYVMEGRPAAQLCLDRCLNDRACRSWTFVKDEDGAPACYIGGTEREPRLNRPCCTSGTR